MPSNLGRHLLGMPYLNRNKAVACADYNRLQFLRIPSNSINHLSCRVWLGPSQPTGIAGFFPLRLDIVGDALGFWGRFPCLIGAEVLLDVGMFIEIHRKILLDPVEQQ